MLAEQLLLSQCRVYSHAFGQQSAISESKEMSGTGTGVRAERIASTEQQNVHLEHELTDFVIITFKSP